jgi:nucleotide-binding universal stress UspA family protein
MSRTILVPLDGTSEAARALPYATLLARRFGPGARLLLVQPTTAPRGTRDSAAGAAALKAADLYLRTTAAPLIRSGLNVATLAPYGPLAESVIFEAVTHEVGFIVAATHGRWGVDRLLHGSIAGDILHASPVPVMFVGPKALAPERMRRIAAALDGERFSAAILPPLSSLAAALDTPLDLLGVVPPLFVPLNDEEGPVPAWTLDHLQLRKVGHNYVRMENAPQVQDQLTALSESLDFWSQQLIAAGARPRPHTFYGVQGPSIAATIIRAAQGIGADVIALRTHARPPVSRFLMGSVADEIVRTSPLPTLLFTSRSLGQPETVATAPEPRAVSV